MLSSKILHFLPIKRELFKFVFSSRCSQILRVTQRLSNQLQNIFQIKCLWIIRINLQIFYTNITRIFEKFFFHHSNRSTLLCMSWFLAKILAAFDNKWTIVNTTNGFPMCHVNFFDNKYINLLASPWLLD